MFGLFYDVSPHLFAGGLIILLETAILGLFSLAGCRTNVEMTINETDDVCDVKGMHRVIFYGNDAKPLRTFCQLYGIEVVT